MLRSVLKGSKPIEFWVLLTAGGIVELINLKKNNNRVFTALIKDMNSHKIGKILLIASWLWLTYHFFFEGE